MGNYPHKGQVLPLTNQMIPISKETTFHASYDYGLHGFAQEEKVDPIGAKSALSFNGVDSFIELLDPDSLMSDSFSIEVSFSIGEWKNSYQSLFSIRTGASWNGLSAVILRNGNSNTLTFSVAGTNGSTNTNCSTPSLSLNTDYQLVATFSPGVLRLYLDGSLVSEYETTVVPKKTGNTMASIGYASSSYYWAGTIYNVAVYKKALSANEVRMTTAKKEPASYWRLSEKEGPISFNHSGDGNDGIWVGNVTPISGNLVATTTEGKFKNGVLIEQETHNYASQDVLGWRSSPSASDLKFRGHVVYETAATTSGGGFRHYCDNGTLEMSPGEKATASLWLNKGTANKSPYFYMQGYSLETITDPTTGGVTKEWAHNDPIHGKLNVERHYYDEEMNDISASYSRDTTEGWVKFVGVLENTHSDKIRLNGSWYFLDSTFTSGTCYHSQPQLEFKEWATSFTENDRPLGKLWYANKNLVNPNEFTISCWINIPHVHHSSSNNAGIQGSWYHPVLDVATEKNTGDSGFSIVVTPAANYSPNRKLALRTPRVGGSGTYVGTSDITDNTWNHMTVTYDGSTYRGYLNGKLEFAYAAGPRPLTEDMFLMVGGGYYGKSNILIDELRIDSRAIPQEEAAAWAMSGLHYNYLDYSITES